MKFIILCAIIVLSQPPAQIQPAGSFPTEITTIENPELITFECTAYCPCSLCCGQWANGITASGTIARAAHTIAASKEYPFGTQIELNGTIYTVEDRGGAIKGNKIDVYFDTHEEALQFGRRKIEGRVLY